MGAVRAGYSAFKKAYLSVSSDAFGPDQFGAYEARAQRYRLYLALWENTAYDSGGDNVPAIHRWAKEFKKQAGLYRYTRGVNNPCYRLVEFWACHLMGGALDRAAGDGIAVPSALPIVTSNEDLRPPIARLWRDSFWEANKSLWSRHGAGLGDAPLAIDVDEEAGRVSLRVVHPLSLVHVGFDGRRRPREYFIEEYRPDPSRPWDPADPGSGSQPMALYWEVCERRPGGGVRYRTFKDRNPFDWNGGTRVQWEADWPFLPLVMARHIDVGLDFGVSELQAAVIKTAEADDAGSMATDYVRRTCQAPWFYAGVRQADLNAALKRRAPDEGTPQNGREEVLSIAAPDPQARAQALVAALDIGDVTVHVQALIESFERDYPEMRLERLKARADSSAKAIREAAKPVKTKVNERRKLYDPVLCEAHKMAVVMGGHLGFEPYAGFGLEDWETDRLEHSIGARPVFDVEDIDRIEEDLIEAQAIQTWTAAGIPVEVALERADWEPSVIARVVELRERDRQRELQQAGRTEPGRPATAEERNSSPARED